MIANGKIISVTNKVHRVIAKMKIQFELGVLRREIHQNGRNAMTTKKKRHGDTQFSGDLMPA
ncbi:hypothetical protein GHA01_28760 [Novacetimonas hansenii]|uniref:Transposase n=1 Tax=Novacetimonas hansenii TaxID=436 RepID=A0ABQ0SK85_NOVHA|nr:hypothetical protein Gaha_0138_014 [Novacetimonas hansenii JCM 7643]GBQ56487.1 hypothetical protein AA0243_1214 [Novacetimonas hansenii NRIC 0243]GEC65027.1 hypothetical protein GHA01_28760 [Novacetimonas hansenii]